MQCEYNNGRQCPKKATVIFVNNQIKAAACNGHRVATANMAASKGRSAIYKTELAR